MGYLGGILAVAIIVVVLWDIFETIILPRRVMGRFRLTNQFYRVTWAPWSSLARRLTGRRRESFLALYGPLSLLALLTVWLAGLIFGFALLQWALGSHLRQAGGTPKFGNEIYFSGTTLLTLGLGDIAPTSDSARAFTVIEVGIGFGVLAAVIGYFPVLYQAFSRREVNVSLLDARGGSPPSAGEILRRFGRPEFSDGVFQTLRDWETWAADLMESHLSYPVLGFFRSQHDNQSWLAALTAILDTCALIIVGVEGMPMVRARLTFAMARHAVVDLSQIYNVEPVAPAPDRLPPEELARLYSALDEAGSHLAGGDQAEEKLARLRSLYEPYVNALSLRLLMPLPVWLPEEEAHEAWKVSPWEV